MIIRKICTDDIPLCCEIYNYYIENTTFTFEENPLSKEDFERRVKRITGKFPYIVAEHDGKIIGYAYLDHYSERSAYRFTADVSIYVDKDFHSLGAGRSLIEALEREARKIGIKNLISIITEENQNSMNFHRKNGYYEKGHLEKVGFKFGKWLDVVIMQKKI